jgi:hypothetical protein
MTLPATDAWKGAGNIIDESACPVCLRESCEGCADDRPADHAPDDRALPYPPAELEDAAVVAAEGQAIAATGIRYVVHDLIPEYGMLAFLVAFAKVGKTTFGQALAAAVASGGAFLDRLTTRSRVLVLAAEDPPEYTAWLARHLTVDPGWLTFRRKSTILTEAELQRICATVAHGRYGFVLIASWQAVIRGLLRDENDNAGAVAIVENVKAAARATGIPWLIDAHSGKAEDQDDDADPSKAMRGASAAAAAADYTLSLRYANGAFGTQRRLSGKGRFVSFPPITLDFDPATSIYTCLGSPKDAERDTTWRLICDTGAVDVTPKSLTDIAQACGLLQPGKKLNTTTRRRLQNALQHPDIGRADGIRRGQKTTMYRRLEVNP